MTVGLPAIAEIERINAIDERRLVDVLARQDPSWGSMTFDLADGAAVLAGPGLFVNQCLGAGLTTAVEDADLEHLEEHAADLVLPAVFEASGATRTDVINRLRGRGYVPENPRQVVIHPLTDIAGADASIVVETVAAPMLSDWQEASAAGWGHHTPGARSANDAYAAAAFVADDPGLLIARSSTDGRLLGVAALRMTEGIATLGGMSTLPVERGRGVQRALIAARLRLADEAGCRVAVAMTEPGSGSLRNLLRAGFVESHTRTAWAIGASR